jgi:eukaryotic-like serine/threonine-protein kinase
VAGRILINDRYELEDLPIARGGMGEVYGARDVTLDREVAVKWIRFPSGVPDEEFVRRFGRESRITARLEHPGVPTVFDMGTHEGRPYMVMQRIRGISLSDLIAEQGRLPIGWAAGIAAQICSVLTAAHEASLLHRDLKPSNVMLEANGSVKVLDFGLAAAPTLPDFSRITHSGQPLGTPGYMAPEQIVAGVSGPHSDLYALGCTLFEMIAGEALFQAATSYSLMTQQVTEPPRPLRQIRPDTPTLLERLVLSLLEKKPENRPASAHAVHEALMPFATRLGMLPGALDPPSTISPTRMYAQVLGRVLAESEPAPRPTDERREPKAPTRRPRAEAAFDRTKLKASLAEARGLVRQSRHNQAAELLESTVHAAVSAFGATDSEVVNLRVELADARFELGDYRGAAPEYRRLAKDVGDPDSRLALRCRLKEATCHALLGDAPHALTQLKALVSDQTRVFGADDPGTIDMRRQIALLQLGAGDQVGATQTLQRLKADLSRLSGPNHPTVREIEDLLVKLDERGGLPG